MATVRHTKAVKKLAWRTGSVALLTACALVLAGPFTYDSQTHQELTESVQAWSVIGNRFLGLDLGAVRDNVFTLTYDLTRQIQVVDHNTAHQSLLLGAANFFSRGGVQTVADALRWFNVSLTSRQAQAIGLCRSLATFHRGEDIVVPADPYQYGIASWYGPGFHGRLAASGEVYDMYGMTAAHRTLPLGTEVRVVHQRTGNSIIVRINDRGPYVGGRILDLSYKAKEALGAGDLAAIYIERLNPSALDVECK